MNFEQKRQLVIEAINKLSPDQLDDLIEESVDLYDAVYANDDLNINKEHFDCGFEHLQEDLEDDDYDDDLTYDEHFDEEEDDFGNDEDEDDGPLYDDDFGNEDDGQDW